MGGMADGGRVAEPFQMQNSGRRRSRSAAGGHHANPQLGSQWHRVMGVKPISKTPPSLKKQRDLETPLFWEQVGTHLVGIRESGMSPAERLGRQRPGALLPLGIFLLPFQENQSLKEERRVGWGSGQARG